MHSRLDQTHSRGGLAEFWRASRRVQGLLRPKPGTELSGQVTVQIQGVGTATELPRRGECRTVGSFAVYHCCQVQVMGSVPGTKHANPIFWEF